MAMNAYQALRLARRQQLVPRLQARQMQSLLRTSTTELLLVPASLQPLCQLLWLANATPPTPTLQ
jgi:hypothetical protein